VAFHGNLELYHSILIIVFRVKKVVANEKINGVKGKSLVHSW